MTEKELYDPIKQEFEKLFSQKGEVYLEITANSISNKIKAQIDKYRAIVFSFLKETKPDISGFFKKEGSFPQNIIIEVKDEPWKLDYIYQARRYAELFDARFAFLVSTQEIPEEIKQLSRVTYAMLSLPAYKKLILCHFDEKTKQIADWYEENPFKIDYHWK
jgi:hypothetical protein